MKIETKLIGNKPLLGIMIADKCITALLDTGADVTCLKRSVVDKLQISVESCKNDERYNVCFTRLKLINLSGEEFNWKLYVQKEGIEPVKLVDCLIGRDLLQHFKFTYDGVNRSFILEYPHDSLTNLKKLNEL